MTVEKKEICSLSNRDIVISCIVSGEEIKAMQEAAQETGLTFRVVAKPGDKWSPEISRVNPYPLGENEFAFEARYPVGKQGFSTWERFSVRKDEIINQKKQPS